MEEPNSTNDLNKYNTVILEHERLKAMRGLCIAIPIGLAMWAFIIWALWKVL